MVGMDGGIMGDTGYGLSPELFRAVFPFHIVLDRGLRIRQLGRVFERICPLLREGRPITDYFDLKRPVIPFTFEGIRQASRSLFLLVCKRKTMELRGEMCHPPGTDLLYFLGTPWITRIDQLGTLGLTLDDFPIHDPIADLLFLIQSQHNTIESTRKLTEELRRQREELRRINRNLALQSQVNRIFTENLPPKELFFRLLGVIGESLGCVAGNVWEEEGQWRASAVWRRFDAPATPSSCRTQASPPLAEYLDRIAREEGIFQDSLEPVIAGEMPGIERLPRGEERSGSSRPASEMFGFPVRIGGKTAALFTFLADAPLCLEESISDTIRDIALRLGREFDRRRAEAALAESEARRQESEKKYRILWENAPEAVLLLDPSGGIRFANPAVTSIFGYPPEEIAGASILRLIAPHCAEGEGEPPPEKLLSRLLSGKRREFLARRKGGERFPIGNRSRPFGERRVCCQVEKDIAGSKDGGCSPLLARIQASIMYSKTFLPCILSVMITVIMRATYSLPFSDSVP
ncbi:MAG: PAS domain S-box protein [Deltaproteobacteria bacterium]|nr:MAG: PAS domain S-box protein [Deltaproteobacteria bacterium]